MKKGEQMIKVDKEQRIDMRKMPVLTVINRHSRDCGLPPNITAKDHYISYFENDYGEQLVYQYNRDTHKGTLWHGDIGWENPLIVSDSGLVMGAILSEGEREWLKLCWRTATINGKC